MVSKVISGVSWSAIERFSVQFVQFIVSMVLARLLTPDVFGLVALALVILNILQTINETGFGAALMQKLDRDELDFSSVFILNLLLGFFLYLLLFLVAPLFAKISGYNELTTVIRLIGLNLIITSFVVVQRTKLYIAVDFKTLAKSSLISVVISGTFGIICAYKGLGVYALVIQSLLNNLLTTIIIWLQVRWMPKLKFSWKRFKSLYNFAYKLILSRFINSVFNEAYSLVIGVFYSPSQLGLFNRAKNFEQLSSGNIAQIVQRVSVPILCEQQNDTEKMRQTLLKFVSYTALLVYPMLVGLFVLAKPLIVVLLTEKWLGAVWILQVLCPVGCCYIISTFHRNIFNATGRTDLALKSEIIRKIVALILIIFSICGGFKILVWSQVVVAIVELIIDLYYTKKQIGLTIFQQINSLLPILFVSIMMGLIVFCLTSLIHIYWLKLLIGIIVGILVYCILCCLFNILGCKRIIINMMENKIL